MADGNDNITNKETEVFFSDPDDLPSRNTLHYLTKCSPDEYITPDEVDFVGEKILPREDKDKDKERLSQQVYLPKSDALEGTVSAAVGLPFESPTGSDVGDEDNLKAPPKPPFSSYISWMSTLFGEEDNGREAEEMPNIAQLNTCSGAYIEGPDLWPARDLRNSADGKAYYGILSQSSLTVSDLRRELHFLSSINFTRRLEVLCKFLVKRDLPLHSQKMQGKLTETALHVALLYQSTEAAKIVMKYGGQELIMKTYNDGKKNYSGVNAIHIAVAQQNEAALVYILNDLDDISRMKLLHQETKGKYFKGKICQARLPLALAACSGNINICNILVDAGAEFDRRNSVCGCSILHNLVKYANHEPEMACNMFTGLLESGSTKRWWLRKWGINNNDIPICHEMRNMKHYLLHLENKNGETPLEVAARLDNLPMAQAIFQTNQVYRFSQWKYGPAEHVMYDMSEVDPCVSPKGKPSILETLIYSPGDEGLLSSRLDPIKNLLETKWLRFRRQFFLWLIVHFLLMVTYSSITSHTLACGRVYWSVAHVNDTETLPYRSGDYCRDTRPLSILGQAFIYIMATIYLITEVWDSVYVLAVRRLLSRQERRKSRRLHTPVPVLLMYDPFRLLLVLFSITALVTPVAQRHQWESLCSLTSVIAALSGWTFLLFFTRAFLNIGIFTVMLQRIMLGDMVHFLAVYLIISLGFATAMQGVFCGSLAPKPFYSYIGLLNILFRAMIGDENNPTAENTNKHTSIEVITTLFILIADIQLLNMLIAAMSDTYAQVASNKNDLWLKIRAKAVLLIERRNRMVMMCKPNINLVPHKVSYEENKPAEIRWFFHTEEIVK